jgi:hypothetical protein
MRERLDEMLSAQDAYYTYQDIVDEISDMGGTISISALCRMRRSAIRRCRRSPAKPGGWKR